jgi:hypothetical protein
MVSAIKRVRGMRMVGAVRRRPEALRPALAPAASRIGSASVTSAQVAPLQRSSKPVSAGLPVEQD